jgi:fatty acid desaturase
VLSGLLVHAFLIVLVHDGAHCAITRTRVDSVLMNLGAGLVLLPFYAEPFRKFHLIHHAEANGPHDPLWPPAKARLYAKRRGVYMLLECLPLVLQAHAVLTRARPDCLRDAGPPVRPFYLAFAVVVTGGVVVLGRPDVGFILATLASTSIWSALRYWCEHFGSDAIRESNTFRFPIGMGIGNHAAHHRYPGFSWLTMTWGLVFKQKDTDPVRTVIAMLRDPAFRHYEPLWTPTTRRQPVT